ncbi:MAG: transcriptional regulator [Brevundimonas sp.]|uniref:transcriptional regulator n=1 Tax=Brevundimonas sp. TaxID=1871086 RepID=UPI0040333251
MINNSYLLGLFGATADTVSSLTTTAATIKRQPTAPWSSAAVAKPSTSALLNAAMAGRKLIDESKAKLDMAGVSGDYKKLFALYQGLESLSALADRATTKNLSSTEQALLIKRFDAGMAEVGAYLKSAGLADVRVVQGVSSASSKTTTAVAKDSAVSITGPIHQGDLSTPVAAFEGDTRFNITVKTRLGSTTTTKTVAIDLSEMGSTARTMDNVIAHINGKLEAEGVLTRLEKQRVATEPKTVTTNGKTTTLPAEADKWSLVVRGLSSEIIGFSATDTSDAVYVVQTTGKAATPELLKFQSDVGTAAMPTGPGVGEGIWTDGRLSQDALPDGVTAVRASAVGPDGSLWLVADVASIDNQAIKGVQDVALMKYDSSGRLLMTRTLGAAATASGYAIAVNADGQVAVAGSITGALDANSGTVSTTLSDSFVTVFNDQGEEQWTQRRGAKAADEATSVSFGADGMVYVAGRSQSAMSGTTAVGGWDGYLQAFSTLTPYAGAKTLVTVQGATQFGTAADDRVDAMTIDGSNLYTAGVENGRAIVRQFTLDAEGRPTLAATRDLGVLSGDIAGIGVANGKVVLTGTSKNSELGGGLTANNSAPGGSDVFVAALSTDLSAAPDERISWYGAAGDDSAADVKVQDGKVWITGVADRALGAKATDPTQAYLARLNPLTGAVEYERKWMGSEEQAKASTLAVASGGASVLDRLGLPQGDIDQSDSQALVNATALRVGDRFYVSAADGGRGTAVTITATDTLATLARKIQAASKGRLVVTVKNELPGDAVAGQTAATAGGFQRLSIVPRDPEVGAILTSGETGRDALAGLGLSAGYIGKKAVDGGKTTFGLDLASSLNLNTAGSIATAQEKLKTALSTLRSAYAALDPEAATKKATGTAPAYITSQIANYQAALDRLTG